MLLIKIKYDEWLIWEVEARNLTVSVANTRVSP